MCGGNPPPPQPITPVTTNCPARRSSRALTVMGRADQAFSGGPTFYFDEMLPAHRLEYSRPSKERIPGGFVVSHKVCSHHNLCASSTYRPGLVLMYYKLLLLYLSRESASSSFMFFSLVHKQ